MTDNGIYFGEIIHVIDVRPDIAQGDASWYEYEVNRLCPGCRDFCGDGFHSIDETYNGIPAQRLTKEGAEEALADFLRECKEGNADYTGYFPKCEECEKG